MFFTKVAKVVAVLGLVAGGARFLTAMLVAMEISPAGAIPRYLGKGTAGEHIDRGLYVMFVCIIVGLLAEISEGVRRPRG